MTIDKEQIKAVLENVHRTTPQGGILDPQEGNCTNKGKNASQGLKSANFGNVQLQREADKNAEKKIKAVEIYKEYQHNIFIAGQKIGEIQQGIKAGESFYNLFLKAIDAIARMTGNPQLYKQMYADILSIYGGGLNEPEPLKDQLTEVQERLTRLRAAEDGEERQRIERAIKTHEAAEKRIKAQLKAGEG